MTAPRSVYVHVPFCRHRCGYCNFTLVAGRDHLVDDYLQALEIEVSQVEGRPEVDTIYLGGGTPSRLPAKSLGYLLKLLDQRFDLVADGEFTIEANPDDLPGEIESVIGDSRINRISLGVQSFNQDKLKSLDRDHDVAQIDSAIKSVREIADRFSIDLIFAAPHDSLEIWQDDLARGIDSDATHVSTYELTYEKGTLFWNRHHHGELQPADDEICAKYYESTITRLAQAGFEHYEISSFARDGHRSQHNQVYWSGLSYLACGPGASGLIGSVRYTNHRSVSRYLNNVLAGESAMEESQSLSARELAVDQLVFGLRMIQGVDLEEFRHQTKFDAADLIPQQMIDQWSQQGLVTLESQRLQLTGRGLLLADTICSRILQESQ